MITYSSGSNYKDIHCTMVYRKQMKSPHDAMNRQKRNNTVDKSRCYLEARTSTNAKILEQTDSGKKPMPK